MDAWVRIRNMDAVQLAMKDLPHTINRKVLAAGMGRGALLVKRAAKRIAPKQGAPGRLHYFGPNDHRIRAPGYLKRKGITYARVKNTFIWEVGSTKAAFYGARLESGLAHVPRRVEWLRQAYRMVRDRIPSEVAKGMEKKLAKEVAKLRQRSGS